MKRLGRAPAWPSAGARRAHARRGAVAAELLELGQGGRQSDLGRGELARNEEARPWSLGTEWRSSTYLGTAGKRRRPSRDTRGRGNTPAMNWRRRVC